MSDITFDSLSVGHSCPKSSHSIFGHTLGSRLYRFVTKESKFARMQHGRWLQHEVIVADANRTTVLGYIRWTWVVFSGLRPKRFWNDRKKLCRFGQNVWKYWLKNTVAASFNTTVRQTTEMFQLTKCLSKKWPTFFSEKKQRWTAVNFCSLDFCGNVILFHKLCMRVMLIS